VLGAVSVATACLLPGSVASQSASLDPGADRIRIEHPTGYFDATVRVDAGPEPVIVGAGIIRTARKLMDGVVFPRSY
jgi:4-oxalomesaconate tautomerase